MFDSALVGIAAFVLVGLLGFGGPWLFGGWSWDPDEWFGPFRWFGVLWFMLVLAGIVTLIVWLAQRLARGGRPVGCPGHGAVRIGGGHRPGRLRGDQLRGHRHRSDHPHAERRPGHRVLWHLRCRRARTTAATTMPPGRLQHDARRAEHDAWRRSQDEANRAACAQLAAENRARAIEFQAQAEEARRIRRLTRPRTSFAYVVATLGAALVAAIASMIALGSAQPAPQAVTIGLAVSAIVTALAMVLAGSLRRRSGFLAFRDDRAAALDARHWPSSLRLPGGARRRRRVGAHDEHRSSWFGVSLTVDEDVAAAAPVEWTLAQGVGSVSIDLRDGARVALVVRCAECTVTHARFDADGDWSVVDDVRSGAGQATA